MPDRRQTRPRASSPRRHLQPGFPTRRSHHRRRFGPGRTQIDDSRAGRKESEEFWKYCAAGVPADRRDETRKALKQNFPVVICHLSFAICHSSFVVASRAAESNDEWLISNGKWKLS